MSHLIRRRTLVTGCLALLWQIFSAPGFTNQFLRDSWVVGLWRADHGDHEGELERRAWAVAQAIP